MSKLRQALLKLKIPESFPSEIVFNAYINPDVDKSNREFTWTLPELDLLRKYNIKIRLINNLILLNYLMIKRYLSNKIGWTIKKIDDDLLPIIKRVQDKMVLFNFFRYCVEKNANFHYIFDLRFKKISTAFSYMTKYRRFLNKASE